MKSWFKTGLVLAEAAVVLAAFWAGQVIKAGQMNANPWEVYTSRVARSVILEALRITEAGEGSQALISAGSWR